MCRWLTVRVGVGVGLAVVVADGISVSDGARRCG